MSLEEWTEQYEPSSNAPIPELEGGGLEPAAGDRRQARTLDKVAAAIAVATGIDVRNLPPVERGEPTDSYDLGTKRTGADTRFHQEHPNIPAHNPDRPSQRPGARRQRYLKQVARDEGISFAEAARRHPERPRKNLTAAS